MLQQNAIVVRVTKRMIVDKTNLLIEVKGHFFKIGLQLVH